MPIVWAAGRAAKVLRKMVIRFEFGTVCLRVCVHAQASVHRRESVRTVAVRVAQESGRVWLCGTSRKICFVRVRLFDCATLSCVSRPQGCGHHGH